MDTKDKIISVVLAVPGAISAIDDLLHPQTSTPKINQETSNNNNTNDISGSNVTNSAIGNSNINNNSNDSIVGNNNSKNTYYINTPTQTPTETFTPIKLPTYTNRIGMEFVQIPSGSFVMGDNNYYYTIGETDYYDESPEHTVQFDKPFYIGKFLVTQKQWNELMDNNPSIYKGDTLPVTNINWNDTQEFIKKLNQKEGTDKYRLPSEAEWEYVCKAGTTTEYYFGDDASKLDDYAWYQRNSMNETHPVGTTKPNPWGVYDMLGNVYEWTLDNWHPDYTNAPTNGSAWFTHDDEYYVLDTDLVVIRGGDYNAKANKCRSEYRTAACINDRDESYYNVLYGFRLVMEM